MLQQLPARHIRRRSTSRDNIQIMCTYMDNRVIQAGTDSRQQYTFEDLLPCWSRTSSSNHRIACIFLDGHQLAICATPGTHSCQRNHIDESTLSPAPLKMHPQQPILPITRSARPQYRSAAIAKCENERHAQSDNELDTSACKLTLIVLGRNLYYINNAVRNRIALTTETGHCGKIANLSTRWKWHFSAHWCLILSLSL